jgi:hypothetical protein
MLMPESAVAAWSDLLDAGKGLHDLAPWRWMADWPAFGIHDGPTGATVYCCVLGAAGVVFGLCAFDGPDGWGGLRRMQAGELDAVDGAFTQHALSLFFEDHEELRPDARSLFKKLRRSYRGRKAWPEATAHRPGYVPRLTRADETALLARVVREAVTVCERVRTRPELLEGRLLVRRDGADTFSGEPPAPPAAVVPPVDAVTRARIAGVPRRGGTWLGDHFFVPAVITDREHHYFARHLVWIDSRSEMVLDAHVEAPDAQPEQALRDRLTACILLHGAPDRVVARRPEVVHALAGLRDLFEVVHDPDPGPFLEIRRSLEGFLQRR